MVYANKIADKGPTVTARLPAPGGDTNNWGTILNDFLGVSHNPDGTISPTALTDAGGITQNAADARYIQHLAPITAAITDNGGQVVNVKACGAIGDGVADDTATIQSAVDRGGVTFFPLGIYKVSGLVLRSKSVLIGVNSGTYGYASVGTSQLLLAQGSNTAVITLPAAAGAGYIAHLEINGNKNAQTSGLPAGILFEQAATPIESQWRIEHCFVHDTRGSGIEIQSNRQANRIRDCAIYGTGYYGIDCSATDQILTGNLIGQCYLDGVLINSSVIHVFAGDIFSNDRNGITITSSARGCMITNTGIDRNGNHGIYSAGSGINIVACTLHSNGLATHDSYGSITIDDTYNSVDSVSIVACDFWLDSGYAILPNYHIEFKNTATAQVIGCGFASNSYATSAINTPVNAGISIAGGGILYAQNGALLYKGTNSTVTTIAPA